MPNTEHRVLEIIFDYGGKASVFNVAREIGFSSDYARMICESLGRRDYIDYWASRGFCTLKEKGAEIGKKAASEREKFQKTMFKRSSSGFPKPSHQYIGSEGKNRRGRTILGY